MTKTNYLIVINVYDGSNILASYNHESESPPFAKGLDDLCAEDLHRTKQDVTFGGVASGTKRVAVVHGIFAL